ncbi:MAG: hypothetical protein C4547_05955 [Phycisphaerales bacterium]|nr:MAG: hypothetical protein C4547_05955 [Phycisphaerales bacterium]
MPADPDAGITTTDLEISAEAATLYIEATNIPLPPPPQKITVKVYVIEALGERRELESTPLEDAGRGKLTAERLIDPLPTGRFEIQLMANWVNPEP